MKLHLQSLDVLRAVAITLVLFFHYPLFFQHPPGMQQWTSFGWTGVDLFFVLSGFLISSQLFAENAKGGIDTRAYFIKRSLRILPLYGITLAVYFLAPTWREIQSPAPLWKYLTFTQNLYLDAINNRSFSHAWSLCIEEQFYLVLPLVLVAVGPRLRLKGLLITLGTLGLAGFLVRWYSWEHFVAPLPDAKQASGAAWSLEWARWIYYCTQTRLDGLLTGVAVGGLFHFRKDVKEWCRQRSWFLVGGGVAVLLLVRPFCTPFTSHACAIWGYPVIDVSYGFILAGLVSRGFELPKAVFFPLGWLATLSYGLYLTHKVVIKVTQREAIAAGVSSDGWTLFALSMGVCVLVALALHFAVERPALALRNRLLARPLHETRGEAKSAPAATTA